MTTSSKENWWEWFGPVVVRVTENTKAVRVCLASSRVVRAEETCGVKERERGDGGGVLVWRGEQR